MKLEPSQRGGYPPVMNWKPKRSKPVHWREYLTDEERAAIKKIDDAKAHWLKLHNDLQRGAIVNRAIKRAHAAIAARASRRGEPRT